MNVLSDLFGSLTGKKKFAEAVVMGDESLMAPKAHGKSDFTLV
jgi:hypothetical protein